MEYPILRYPDPSKPYTIYTDVSGIGWSEVLTQEDQDNKGRIKSHPICFISSQFRGSQLNWAALTKEAYAIYICLLEGLHSISWMRRSLNGPKILIY